MLNILKKRDELRLLALFFLLLALYLAIAYLIYVPWEYYGTYEEPRLADPWIERSQTIISGKLLYRDVFTATPPLTNYLLLIPSLVPIYFGEVNPWTTLSFMLYFAFFNLLTAYLLFYMSENRAEGNDTHPSEGWQTAAYFLLNPLTFGNSILRRQDEAILVFFFALALWMMMGRHHLRAALAIGAVLLIKLSGLLLIPVAFLQSRNWKYLIIPPLLFGLVLAPFLLSAGEQAIFWDFNKSQTQHPFQLSGISLSALWYRYYLRWPSAYIEPFLSVLFVVGMASGLAFIAWKRLGLLESLTILIATVLLLLPKLHAGYFGLLALSLAPLVKPYRLGKIYLWLGLLVLLADLYKSPIKNYLVAASLMTIVYALLVVVIMRVSGTRLRERRKGAEGQSQKDLVRLNDHFMIK